ncbi:hypothetical protein ACFE04_000518 [Oxalis oulophora]
MEYYKTIFVAILLSCFVTTSFGVNETEILLKFRNSLSNDQQLNDWLQPVPPCDNNTAKWNGLYCKGGSVNKLLLTNMGLTGMIDMDALSALPNLRSLDLTNNSFDGPIPAVNNLGALRSLFFSNNKFSGEIPKGAFSGLGKVTKVSLDGNSFVGRIPKSLAELPLLAEVNLEGNQFDGELPEFKSPSVTMVNVANNKLEGSIPAKLSSMSSSYFTGNNLCGKPMARCKSNKKKTIIIIAILGGLVVALSIIAAINYHRFRSRQNKMATTKFKSAHKAQNKFGPYSPAQIEPRDPYPLDHGNGVGIGGRGGGGGDTGKLHFVRKDRENFELQDLLKASAEVLGSGSFGSSYKAVILDGPAMVVKRFRDMNNVGQEEFYEHMQKIGNLSHPNLLPLVAFYCGKEEKLLVSDYAPNGSVANYLHVRRTPEEPGLDWPTRLKIVKGVARGLTYLYKELPNLTLPHGHLKSSNVLLDSEFEPLLSEYTLAPVINKDHAQKLLAAYKSPEFSNNDRPTRKTDVWSLGILILEMLTGKFPSNYLKQGKGGNSDLATWVNSVVREEWTGEVFDKDMKGTRNGEGEMLKLLKIGMCCCESNIERRWDLREAAGKIEELKETETDLDDYSSYNSEGEMYSSMAMTEEGFSFSVAKD